MYNAIASRRTSSLETPLNSFAHLLHESKSKEDIQKARQDLKASLIAIIPTKEEFVANFKELKYSKNNISTNMLTKYIMNKFESIYSDSDLLESESSIEHIMDEVFENEQTLNIGNLLLLEQRINSSIPSGLKLSNKKNYYSESKYVTVDNFAKEYVDLSEWTEEHIESRSISLGELLYTKLVEIINAIA